ncbi:hypothetical protein FWK35_00010806 [Aphis craccivora]|uniref:Uncharacterized protein n=1 Tax=Aphis craccivora TaxID=307492 RepID=A0A6G0ZDA3_APHCR|nr:hypothetical protein FWK35_00010806 [Aphis craccivora]
MQNLNSVFNQIYVYLCGCNSKNNHCKYLKFSPNCYVSVIYIHVDKIILDYQSSNFYEICRKRENLQRNDNHLSQTHKLIYIYIRTLVNHLIAHRMSNTNNTRIWNLSISFLTIASTF